MRSLTHNQSRKRVLWSSDRHQVSDCLTLPPRQRRILRQFRAASVYLDGDSVETTQIPSDSRSRIIVVGGGRMGVIRAKALLHSSKATLVGLVETNRTRAKELSDLLGVPLYTNLLEALRNNSNLNGVWIASPTCFHRTDIETSLRAGLGVGVEKPIASCDSDIENCYRLARLQNLTLFCSFQRRVDPSYRRLLHQAWRGEIGTIRSVHAVFRDHPIPPLEFLKSGGDIFGDLAVHDVDFIMHLLRERPVKLYARGTAFHPELRASNVMDTAHVMLEFASGAVATIELSRTSVYGYDQRLEVFGSEGMLQVTNPPSTQVVTSSKDGITTANPTHSFPQRFAQAYEIEIDDFSDCLAKKRSVEVSVEDCVASARIANLSRSSAASGMPVFLTL